MTQRPMTRRRLPIGMQAFRTVREREHHTAIDQLRVALSRATETLAFVDVVGAEDAHRTLTATRVHGVHGVHGSTDPRIHGSTDPRRARIGRYSLFTNCARKCTRLLATTP